MKRPKMNRTQIYFTEKEHNLLKKEAEKKELTMADVTRRIIDDYFKNKEIEKRNESNSDT